MDKVRDWKQFWRNLKPNLGLLVFSTLGLALLLFGITQKTVLLIIVGSVLILFGIGSLISVSIPSKKLNPEKYLGQKRPITDIDKFYPSLKKVGVVGLSNVGKTTLTQSICQQNYEGERTQNISFLVTQTRNYPTKYLALIDGPGNNFPNQFSIVGYADYLILMLDHNESDESTSIDQNRLDTAEAFQMQLRNAISGRSDRIENILVILNKQDLWDGEDSQPQLSEWFNEQTRTWEQGNFSQNTNFKYHSKDDAGSCNEIMNLIN